MPFGTEYDPNSPSAQLYELEVSKSIEEIQRLAQLSETAIKPRISTDTSGIWESITGFLRLTFRTKKGPPPTNP